MADFTSNAAENVAAGKGVLGGYCYRAPVGTALPTSPSWTPTNAWTCMGYIADDGVTFSTDSDSTDFNDLNGTVIETSRSNFGESFSCDFVETKRSVFESIYGEDSVTDENGVLTVNHQGEEPGYYTYAFLFVLKNGRKWVRFAEQAKCTEINDLTINSTTLVRWGATYKVVSGSGNNYFVDKFESTETVSA